MKKAVCPDWSKISYMLVSKDENGRFTTESCTPELYISRLSATLEVRGGGCTFGTYKSAEEREAERLQEDRRATWRNGISVAQVLVNASSLRRAKFMVGFYPDAERTWREEVRIYEVFEKEG